MTTFQILTIAGNDYNSFSTLEYADAYLAANPNATAWQALADAEDTRKAWLVSATRVLVAQTWQPGALNDPLDQRVIDATVELALAMAGGFDAANSASTATGIKIQKAGTVMQEFFAPGFAGTPVGTRFPLSVMDLIGGLLGSAGDGGFGGSFATGTCGQSISEIDYSPNAYPTERRAPRY